jgi:hypothetical protein
MNFAMAANMDLQGATPAIVGARAVFSPRADLAEMLRLVLLLRKQ